MSIKTPDTPCIGICSTVYGDEVCRGCKRHYREIIDWNRYDALKKRAVLCRLEANIVTVMRDEVEIVNAQCLQQQLDRLHIRYWQEQDPLCWAYYLLRAQHQYIDDVGKYGIKLIHFSKYNHLHQFYQVLEATLLNRAQQTTL